MATLRLTVDVDASVEQTWAAVTDWPNQHRWMVGTHVAGTDQQGQGVGGGLRAVTKVGPVSFVDTMQITAWDPPNRCVVLHTGKVVRGTASFVVEAAPGGRSRFVWTEDLDLPLGLVGRIGWVAVRPLAAAGVGYSLRRFARWVPTRA